MQLTFEADTPAAGAGAKNRAKSSSSSTPAASAPTGTTPRCRRKGTHPIVYPAAGSHATFYDSAVYVQNGQHGSGRRLRQHHRTAARTAAAAGPAAGNGASETGPFKWLSYYGRWGEREKGFNNGPTGPQTKTVWREPFAWMAEQRTTSPRLPGGSIAGPQVTGAFCGAVAAVSDFINLEAKSRPAGDRRRCSCSALLIVALRRLHPLAPGRPRPSCGRGARSARSSAPRASSTAATGGCWCRSRWPGWCRSSAAPTCSPACSPATPAPTPPGAPASTSRSADLVERSPGRSPMAVVAAIVIVFVRAAGRRPAGRLPQLLARHARSASGGSSAPSCWRSLGVLLLAMTVIGLPFAVWKLVGWAFVQQEVLFTDKSIRESLRGSSELVRGRWWRAVRVVVFLFRAQLRRRPGPHLRADLHDAAAALDQPARLADLRPADPLRGARRDAALLRPAGAGGRPSRRSRAARGACGARVSSVAG